MSFPDKSNVDIPRLGKLHSAAVEEGMGEYGWDGNMAPEAGSVFQRGVASHLIRESKYTRFKWQALLLIFF